VANKLSQQAKLAFNPREQRLLEMGADVCPICGKAFFSTAEWAYRRVCWVGSSHLDLPVCSWSCYRKKEGLVPMSEKRW